MLRLATLRAAAAVRRVPPRPRNDLPRLLASDAPNQSSASTDTPSDSDTATDSAPTAPESGEAALAAQLAESEATIAEMRDRGLRALAEMENVRMIARRDVANAREFGITSFARGLLDVADNLGLALKAVPQETLDGNHELCALHEGVQATERELLKVFTQNGVVLFEAPSQDAEPGTVLAVTKVGYAIGERILRPADVGVAKAK
jgi:molecular chaperone GrpE